MGDLGLDEAGGRIGPKRLWRQNWSSFRSGGGGGGHNGERGRVSLSQFAAECCRGIILPSTGVPDRNGFNAVVFEPRIAVSLSAFEEL